ncbi:hypothetical protein DER46DRAFT_656038 [Fusarium sp. MPI-SDFR-AT-0072]|nr:hypothetical protein DER46DRAFT_656038 [Fusarium sp. MPI-SDFR-AT-0072]
MSDRNNNTPQSKKDPKAMGDSEQLVCAGSQSGQHESTAQGARSACGADKLSVDWQFLRSLGISADVVRKLPSVEGKIGQVSMCVLHRRSGREVKPPLALYNSPEQYAFNFILENRDQLPQLLELTKQIGGPGQMFSGHRRFMTRDSPFLRTLYDMEGMEGVAEMASRSTGSLPATGQVSQQGSGQMQIGGVADREPQSQGGGQDQDAHPNKRLKRVQCVGCGSDKHRLSDCLKAGDDGLMKGCPRCNTASHNASNCRCVKTDKDRFVWFVKKRCNMPSFLDFNTWYRLASAKGGLTAQDRFPWTAEFTKFIADDIEQFQNDLDTLGLEGELKVPEDPGLLGWRAVETYHQRRAREDQKALDASQETVVVDGVVMNKKRAAMILS